MLLLTAQVTHAEEIIKSGNLQIVIDPSKAVWSIEKLNSGESIKAIQPSFDIEDLQVDLST